MQAGAEAAELRAQAGAGLAAPAWRVGEEQAHPGYPDGWLVQHR